MNDMKLGRSTASDTREKLSSQDVISLLNLEPLPGEGGFFHQTYKSSTRLDIPDIGNRAVSTAIYYLMTQKEFSALHRLKHDEVFHFYRGTPVEMLQIYPDGQYKIFILGNDVARQHMPQVIVPSGVWQGLRLLHSDRDDWALLGTTVAPGFEFADFELGDRASIADRFPDIRKLIEKFTRD